MKQRIIMLALLLAWGVLVVTVGGLAVKAGSHPAIIGGIEVAALVLGIAAAIVVRVRLGRA